MTIDEFLQNLHEEVVKTGIIFDTSLRFLRNTNKECPICFLCKRKTGHSYWNFFWRQAAKELGLSEIDAKFIADAADKHDVSYSQEIRNSLIKSLQYWRI